MKIIIIGGVAGGATAAARLRRMDEYAEIIVIERGNYISYANCGLPYHIGGSIEERKELLLHSIESFTERYDVDIRNNCEVTAINSKAKQVTVLNLKSGKTYNENFDKLILSPGAQPIKPKITGVENSGIFTLRNIPDMDSILSHINETNPKKAVVVGGGFIGLEMVENLAKRGIKCTLIERESQVMAPFDYSMASIIHHHIRKNGIELYLDSEVVSFHKIGEGLEVKLRNGESIETDMVVLSIGVKPETNLAASAGIEIGKLGGISVNEFMQTSNEDIYAIGDAVEVYNPILKRLSLTPLAGPANKQARIVADNILEGNKYRYSGTLGTAIAKFLDLTIACTGSSEKKLKDAGIQYQYTFIHARSHASYYPSSEFLSIKMLFDPADGEILGAMIVGIKGVDKRIDLISAFIKTGGTIYDLQELEHAYAPPYSSAKDPLNMCGYVAENIVKERVRQISWREIDKLDRSETIIIDVRINREFNEGHIGGAVNYPLNELREWLDEIPKDKLIVTCCLTGMRSYIAYRILIQNGFKNVLNLAGGYMTYYYASQS